MAKRILPTDDAPESTAKDPNPAAAGLVAADEDDTLVGRTVTINRPARELYEFWRDLRARHNLAYWEGRDYVGLGIGAVSTVGNRRWRNAPSLRAYLAALAGGERPRREHELLSDDVRRRERVMLGLRLDEPLEIGSLSAAVDREALARLVELGLVTHEGDSSDTLALTSRGRFLGGRVTAELLA